MLESELDIIETKSNVEKHLFTFFAFFRNYEQ